MRRRSFLTLVLIVTLFSLTSCFKMTRPSADDTPEPAVTVIYVNVTEEPSPESNTGVRPTRVKATPVQATPVPTPIPPQGSQPYYTEEFDKVPDNWVYEIMRGNEDKTDITVGKGVLTFDINDLHTYAYLFYEDWTYEDVYLEASAKNRGYNDNNISLICRYSNEGMYEVSIRSDGLYQIWVYTTGVGYKELYNGGSRRINTGQLRNVFSMSCVGNEISLYVNGTLERTITDNRYELPEGMVGVGASTLYSYPVTVDFDYVTISRP